MKVNDFYELKKYYPKLARKARRIAMLRCLIEMREIGFKKDYKCNMLLWDLHCIVGYFNAETDSPAMSSFRQWAKFGQEAKFCNFYIIQTWKRVIPKVKVLRKEYLCLTK